MKQFNILLHDFNHNQVEIHDIMPYLMQTYMECKKDGHWWPCPDPTKAPNTYEECKEFVNRVCMHMYWSRCQYEWLMLRWPPGKTETLEQCQEYLDSAIKIDGYEQIKMNLDTVTSIFIENVNS